MGCKDTVLPEPLLKNHNVKCLTFVRITLKTSNDNICLFNNSEEGDISKFQGVHLNDIPKVEDLLQLNIFLFDIDFVDGELTGELALRRIQTFEKSVKRLRYNIHICYVNNINALFQTFQCTTCDTFFSKTGNLELHLVTCTDRVKQIYQKRFAN